MDTPQSANSAEGILIAALDHAQEDREAFLITACKDDAALLAEVRALLAAHEAMPTDFLAKPAVNTLKQGDLDITIKATPGTLPSHRALPSSEKSGDRIGPYKLLQEIGEGGFGTVWMADQEKPVRRRVALKIIKLGMDTKEVVARFEQERQALAMMDHPNIARVFDAGATEQGRPFFVMELVRGMKITDYCDEKGLSTAERVELFILVCQAVQHAHQKGIIHRDLKPSNILVTVNDGKAVPKVIDFGVAKATQGRLTDGTLFTQFEQMIGTPLYMSPEQAEMTSLDVDTRSDIYSLGVLLYELLTGRTPIDTATMAKAGMGEIRRLIREVDPPRPSMRLKTLDGNELTTMAKRRHTEPTKLPGALRGDIDWIVMKCLEKDRGRRYDTANGLALDLRRHLANEVVIACPPSAGYLLSKLIRRNKAAFAAGLAIAASLVIGIAASLWQAVRATLAERQAVTALDELRATAPAFADQARSLAAKEQYGEAIEKLDYAIKLRPGAAEFLVQKADLLQCQFRLAEASAVYRAALALQPDHARAGASAKLCEELLAAPPGPDGKLSRESLGKLHLAMQKQQRPAAELLPAARLLGEEREHLIAYWLERLKDLPVSPEKPLKERLTFREDGLMELDLTDTQINDLTLLVGMPLGKLELWNCGLITDFSPLREFRSLTFLNVAGCQFADTSLLRDLPLETLWIPGTQVADLTPLRGKKLKSLILHECRVSDLTPLEGMPLTEFQASELPYGTDYSPLKGLPLEKCLIGRTLVEDLSFLASCPLKELCVYECSRLRGLSWLNEIQTLERLILPANYRTLPEEDVQAIARLRDHPRLAFVQGDAITRSYQSMYLFDITQSKDIFWRDWDREQTFLPAIRATGFDFSLSKLPDDTYRLDIQNQEALRDLSFLKGAPISTLLIGGSKVTDLTPIATLPLRNLYAYRTPISDLSPLQGMAIEVLTIEMTNVSDLSPLEGLPLETLYLHNNSRLSDISVIERIPTLKQLTVPITARGIEKLRGMPNLKWLAFTTDPRSPMVLRTAAETFWERWPSMAWSRALNEQGITYTATEGEDELWSVTVTSKSFSDCSIFKGGRLRELSLYDTSVSDLRPLEALPLTKLNVQRTLVRDLSPLRAPVLSGSLKSLNLGQCNITDFSPLQACTNLEKLEVGNSSLADLSVLHAPKLEQLELHYTKVADISALAGLPLTYLRLDGTPVKDVSPLRQCPKLQSLVLPQNAQNVPELKELPALSAISFKLKPATPIWLPDQKAVDFWLDYEKAGWRNALREVGIAPTALTQLDDGTWSVNLDKAPIQDLSVLRGAPISKLTISNTKVTDLTPLKGMPLRSLTMHTTQVQDLKPLEGMKLEFLHVSGTQVTDLSPLHGMPLTSIHLSNTKVSSLLPLKGMPLVQVRLSGCPQLTDLSPLQDCPTLTAITLPPNAKEIEFLRDLPNLQRISYTEALRTELPDKSKDEFWSDYDTERKFNAIPGIAGRFKKIGDGEWELNLEGSSLHEFSRLEGLPIVSLKAGNTTLGDLAPLRGLKLKTLWLYGCPVTDLRPLEGMPLEDLDLRNGPVADLAPLTGLPMRRLDLRGCSKLTDVSGLAKIPTLQALLVPVSACNIDGLKGAKNLQRLSFRADSEGRPVNTVAEFWEQFAWIQKLHDRQVPFTATETGYVKILQKEFADGSVFAGATIVALDLSQTSVTDLQALAGLPLNSLNLNWTPVSDLSPLRTSVLAQNLRFLNLRGSKITDLAPLQDCQSLQTLDLSETQVTDLSPLKGLKLTSLRLHNTPVTEISALASMPLISLTLNDTAVTDVSALLHCPTLEVLGLPPRARQVLDLQALDRLKIVSFNLPDPLKLPEETAAGFWNEFQKNPWRLALREAGIDPVSSSRLTDGTFSVSFAGTGFNDLSILKGASISSLDIGNTKVTDLSPLKDLPLAGLRLYNTAVTNLSPLQGKPLRALQLSGTPVTDLSVLRGMPLTDLRLHGCSKLTDLSPLADAKELIQLTLPPKAADLNFLRDFPKLQRLSFSEGRDASGLVVPDLTAGEFWALRDFATKFPEAKDRIRKQGDGTWNVDLSRIGFTDGDFALLQPLNIGFLNLTGTQVTSLEPLKDLQLQLINLAGSKVSDISALRGMPLVTAKFAGCKDLHDLSLLAGAKELKNVTLPPEPGDIAFLRSMSKLERISFTENPNNQYLPDKTAAEFWKEYDAKKPKSP